jgi:SAM-dependent methyltransferase
MTFVRLVKESFVRDPGNIHVLEIGSYDFNGSIRQLFPSSNYVGVDLCEGPGVDLVCFGHEVTLPDASIDVAISCECFEHDPNWIETMKNMYRMAKPGGLVIVTCATLGRIEHGTRRSASEFSPGTQFVGLDYYKNLSQADLEAALDLKSMFSDYLFFTMPTSYDLYFVGWKNGETQFGGDKTAFSNKVSDIRKIRRFRLKLYDVPVNIARRIIPEDGKFQDFACGYYNTIKPFRRFVKSLTHPKRS